MPVEPSRRIPAPKVGWLARFGPELLLGAAALVVLTLGVARVPLLDPDEARYAAASRTMLDRGDLVVPYFNGAERLNKPALFYWLQAASFRLLGPGEGAARLPSVLAALLVLVAVYRFASRELGREAAVRAGFILLTCPLFAIVGKTGITDMTLCLAVVLALLSWYRSYVGRGSARLAWLGTSLSLGLAFFIKGPVGVAVPCLVIAVFLALRGDWAAFRPKAIVAGALVAGAVFLPWACVLVYRLGQGAVLANEASINVVGQTDVGVTPGLAEALHLGAARVIDLLRRETVERTLHGLDHPEPLFYFAIAGFVVFFPWFAFWPFAFARALPEIRRRDPGPLFLAVWFLTVIVFFSLIRGKLPTYVLSAAPPLALLLGREWSRTPRQGSRPATQRGLDIPTTLPHDGVGAPPRSGGNPARPRQLTHEEATQIERGIPSNPLTGRYPGVGWRPSRWVWGGSMIVVLLTVGLLISAQLVRPDWLEGHGVLLAGCAALILLAALVPLLARCPGVVDLALASAMTGVLIVVPLATGRLVGETRSLRSLALEADVANRPWTKIITYKTFRPSLVFYGHRNVVYVDSPRALRSALEPESLVVMEERRLRELRPSWQDTFRIVAAQGTMLAISPIAPLPPQGSKQGSR